MVRIRMTRPGLNVSGAVRRAGEEVDVDREVAAYLVPGGHAELLRDHPVEATVTGPSETTSARSRRRTKRG